MAAPEQTTMYIAVAWGRDLWSAGERGATGVLSVSAADKRHQRNAHGLELGF